MSDASESFQGQLSQVTHFLVATAETTGTLCVCSPETAILVCVEKTIQQPENESRYSSIALKENDFSSQTWPHDHPTAMAHDLPPTWSPQVAEMTYIPTHSHTIISQRSNPVSPPFEITQVDLWT